MKRNYRTELDYRYTEQQKAINTICAKLGVVPYRPDYHAKDRDCNTVLIYTAEAHKHNTDLDKEYREKWGGFFHPLESEYKPHFCSLENTDINGHFDLNFMNYGKIDLRGLHTAEILESYITEALKRHTEQ